MGPRGERVPGRGDIYSVDPTGTEGRELRGRHFFIVVSPVEINRLGVAVAAAITTGGMGARHAGTAIPLTGSRTNGVVVCNQIRALDLQARVRIKNARFVETIDPVLADVIASTVASVIDPAPSD